MADNRDCFQNALNDFTSDIVYGDSVRHLAKKGMTVKEISDNLTYPAGIDNIKDIVWKFYLSSGIIRLEKPDGDEAAVKQVRYVCDRDKYGRVSYRKVEESVSEKSVGYVACDFGKCLYNNRDSFMQQLMILDPRDRDYILGLPWPLGTVYHVRDERMERIAKLLGMI